MLNNFDIKSLKITKDQVITSNNFSKRSDIVFSQFISNTKYEKLKNNQNTYIIEKYNDLTLYILSKFELKENDIIFSNTLFLDILFSKMENINNLKNIILITSQSDIPIDKKLFQKKPKCISKWFSINVHYQHKDLIPIPLGIPETRNTKNVIFEDFKKADFVEFNNKEETIYSNFNLNTRYFHRYNFAKKAFRTKQFSLSSPDLKFTDYVNQLSISKYNLAPWGNGIDTHRFWEILYAGSIPITMKHTTFQNFNDLPVIFLKSLKDLKYEHLKNYKFRNINFDKLKVDWWVSLIESHKNGISNEKYLIEFNELEIKNFYTKKINDINKYKKIKTTLRKIHKHTLGKRVAEKVIV